MRSPEKRRVRLVTAAITMVALACLAPSGPKAASQPQAIELPPVESRDHQLDRRAWLEDFEFLKHALVRSYSHLAWFGSYEGGVDLPALNKRTLLALNHANTDADAEAAVLEFVSGFHDPHFARVQNFEPGEPFAEPAPRPLDETASAACAAYGYSPATRIAFTLPFESLNGFSLVSDGIASPFRSGAIDVDGVRIGILRIPRFRAAEYAALCVDVWNGLREKGMSADPEMVSDEIDAAWLATLGERLNRLRDMNVEVMLVDVGGNGGGNDLGDWAVRAFTAKPVHSARLLVSAGEAGESYLNEQIDNLRNVLDSNPGIDDGSRQALISALGTFEDVKSRTASAVCDMRWVWRERRNWNPSGCARLVEAGSASGYAAFAERGAYDPRVAGAIYWASNADQVRGAWDGPVYVLTDERTASAAEMFAALMRDGVGARIVGARTAGLGCGFMASDEALALPRSGLAFRIPNCVRLRSGGTDEVAGVTPDIPVSARKNESARARAMRLLQEVAHPIK